MKLQVVSPWYPRPGAVFSGVFVQKQVEAVARLGIEVSVEVPEIFPAPAGPVPDAVVAALSRLAQDDPLAAYPQIDEATLIPTPVPARSGFTGRSQRFVDSIRQKRKHLPSEVDITHAHLGVPTGWALDQLESGPLIVTEHQSTLGMIFAEKRSRQQYAEIVEAADRFFCVSTYLRNQVVDALGAWSAEKVEVMPNIVDLDGIPFIDRQTFEFSSWIYVGALVAHKGVRALLESFACYRQSVDRTATLTLVGDGVMRSWVERYVAANGLGGAVSLVGSQPHAKVGEFLGQADVLVHLSEGETFGIASLEGIASGLPVVSFRNGGAESSWGDFEAECGLLLDKAVSPESVAARIAELKSDPSRLNLPCGRAMVEERFAPHVVGARLVEAYESCL